MAIKFHLGELDTEGQRECYRDRKSNKLFEEERVKQRNAYLFEMKKMKKNKKTSARILIIHEFSMEKILSMTVFFSLSTIRLVIIIWSNSTYGYYPIHSLTLIMNEVLITKWMKRMHFIYRFQCSKTPISNHCHSSIAIYFWFFIDISFHLFYLRNLLWNVWCIR